MRFPGVGDYDIPQLLPETYSGSGSFISFNEVLTCRNPENQSVHFFVDDYRFLRLWTNPDRYMEQMAQFEHVFTPDFSTYTDWPMALQIYNHYRKHWLGAYMQLHGISVIPTISWSGPESYAWCFDGEPVGGAVAVSSVGTQMSKESRRLFLEGYMEMIRRLEPETILFYGGVPEACMGNIVRIRAFQDKFTAARCDGW